MKITLIPVSQEIWNSKEMEIVRQQTKVSARRIQKGIDIRLERTRFTNACNRIEELALQTSGDYNIVEIEGENIDRFLDSLPGNGDLQFPFIEPEDFTRVLNLTSIKSLKKKLSSFGGIVLLVDAFNGKPCSFNHQTKTLKKKQSTSSPDYSVCDVDMDKLEEEHKRFHEQIRISIETGIPLGWINIDDDGKGGLVRHEAIITAIWEYIYVKEQPKKTEIVDVIKAIPDEEATEKRNKKWYYKVFPFLKPVKPVMKNIQVKEPKVTPMPINPINIQVAYEDGSIGADFPLFGLLKTDEPPPGLPIIKAALISNRHFELDSEVDMCLIRNTEISRREDATIGEQEQLSFDIVYKFLDEFIKKNKGLELQLYHTGLEPAVIGTYRAILKTLLDSNTRGKLKVIPKMFRGYQIGFQNLKAWY